MYFKLGRKVQPFGICCDSNNIPVNYLVDESETIGKNGTMDPILFYQCWIIILILTV